MLNWNFQRIKWGKNVYLKNRPTMPHFRTSVALCSSLVTLASLESAWFGLGFVLIEVEVVV